MKTHLICTAIDRLTEVGARGAKMAQPDHILMLVRGMTLLKDVPIGFVTKPVAFNQDLKALVANENVNPLFLSYLLVEKKRVMMGLVNTANHGTGRLDTNLLKALPIDIPPLPEQRKIADILSTWDRAIETSEALLATARTQKRALMQSLLTGKRRFPEFEEQEWKIGGLDLLAEIHMGQSPAGSTYNSDGIGSPLLNGPTEFTDRHPVARQWTTKPTKMCKDGDVLVCVRGSSTGRMNVADGAYCIGRGIAAVRKRNGLTDTVYLQQLLHSLVELVLSRAAGSTFPNIDKKSLNALQVHIPTYEAQKRIGLVLADADDEIDSYVGDIKNLHAEKKALMQQLLTGKRRVNVDA
ncbi:type I restriction enzyme S subunit [Sulfitobacter undariae]|uniref:Type I restriction enzyme S subunit n=1 Tax=Sulfitobacter undariae TaxID=1563671 RepID=A0A7W6E9P9_9RHOB|nr:type I restriction enzyme S subunit [Sulfitobacter undariae]